MEADFAHIRQLTALLTARGEQIEREQQQATAADVAQVRRLSEMMAASNERYWRQLSEATDDGNSALPSRLPVIIQPVYARDCWEIREITERPGSR